MSITDVGLRSNGDTAPQRGVERCPDTYWGFFSRSDVFVHSRMPCHRMRMAGKNDRRNPPIGGSPRFGEHGNGIAAQQRLHQDVVAVRGNRVREALRRDTTEVLEGRLWPDRVDLAAHRPNAARSLPARDSEDRRTPSPCTRWTCPVWAGPTSRRARVTPSRRSVGRSWSSSRPWTRATSRWQANRWAPPSGSPLRPSSKTESSVSSLSTHTTTRPALAAPIASPRSTSVPPDSRRSAPLLRGWRTSPSSASSCEGAWSTEASFQITTSPSCAGSAAVAATRASLARSFATWTA